MRRILIVVLLIVAAAVLGMWRSSGGVRQGLGRAVGLSNEEQQGEARDEIRKSFQLQPGARVEVQGINGAVDIQTSDTTMAEVYVLRTANSQQVLNRREVVIEETPNGLLVRGRENRNVGFFERIWGRSPNEQVTIKAPRKIALALKGINGRVNTGDIEGALEAKGINGRVDLGQAAESAEISGINGNVSVGLNQLGDQGARVKGVNGNIELRLASTLNADLTAKGMNGNLRSEIPGVTVDKEGHRSRYSARIGTGGAPITLSGINGNVRLTASLATAASEKSLGTDVAADAKASRGKEAGKDAK